MLLLLYYLHLFNTPMPVFVLRVLFVPKTDFILLNHYGSCTVM